MVEHQTGDMVEDHRGGETTAEETHPDHAADVGTDPVDLSQRLLRAVRSGEHPAETERRLRSLDRGALADALATDDATMAFWLNVYNATVQLALERQPRLYDSRRRFFGTDLVEVAGVSLGLDDIEHGFLRGGQHKLGLGYLPDPLAGSLVSRWGLSTVDERIHFALNCGATSCPPIAVYTAADIDDELDLAARSYLAGIVEYRPDDGVLPLVDADGVVEVPRQCLWFRGDFGGKRGILRILRRHDLLPPDVKPRVTYADYDWKRDPGRYANGGQSETTDAGGESASGGT